MWPIGLLLLLVTCLYFVEAGKPVYWKIYHYNTLSIHHYGSVSLCTTVDEKGHEASANKEWEGTAISSDIGTPENEDGHEASANREWEGTTFSSDTGTSENEDGHEGSAYREWEGTTVSSGIGTTSKGGVQSIACESSRGFVSEEASPHTTSCMTGSSSPMDKRTSLHIPLLSEESVDTDGVVKEDLLNLEDASSLVIQVNFRREEKLHHA